MNIENLLFEQFKIKPQYIRNIISLIDEGNTIPFIARYRKELTGSLDDQVLREFNDRLIYLRSLEKRKQEVLNSIESQDKLNQELVDNINNAKTLAEVEDIYRPFKPKRKTRASVAREKGLEPLANIIVKQDDNVNLEKIALEYINSENGVQSYQDAINGAMDIIAEDISDNALYRKLQRDYIYKNGNISSKAINKELDTVYNMYYEYSEPINKIVGHRILAIDRGERENVLKVSIDINKQNVINIITNNLIKNKNKCSEIVMMACVDSFDRLIFPSIEREIRSMLSDKASEQAIKVFSANLRQLLLQPPVKNTVTLGLDPAYRTGCKIAIVDDTGKVLDTTVIYPTPPQNKIEQSKDILKNLIYKHNVTTIAIGNGTASRESENFIAQLISELDRKVSYMVVSESGASVYSASKLASEEFPDFDVSLRSAVSIARRLQDPLAELVKIDPKAIGVGQYQHDMPKTRLDTALCGVVEDCVNSVGVDLNRASYSLLSYIAGINSTVAKNIVAYREEYGAFTDRKQLLNVSKLGKKAFEQSAGFLRIIDGENPLDNTSVHPESYNCVKQLLSICGFKLNDINKINISDFKSKVDEIGLPYLSEKLNVGEPTLKDIITEIVKPGRDPRDELPKPLLRSDVMEIKDLKVGMELKGTVRNITDFGAFVDIGVHDDGLVHISQICDKYIKHPLEAVNVGDIVTVWILDIDEKRKRISLTMKKNTIQ